jgi:hypothetical protein
MTLPITTIGSEISSLLLLSMAEAWVNSFYTN